MDIKQLRYFLEIYRSGNVATAAKKIYISQQGLSMSLLRLEKELSCKLLKRSKNGLVLTPEGEYLLPHAEKLVSEFYELENHFTGPSDKIATLNIACALGAISEFLAPALFTFQRQNPQYKIMVEETSDIKCDELIETKNAEIGFGISPINSSDNKFVVKKVFKSPFCLLVNKNTPLADLRSVSLDILRDLPVFVMNNESKTRLILNRCCEKNGFLPEIKYSAAEVVAIHRMVAANTGSGISVLSVAEDLPHPDVVAIPFKEPEMIWELNMFKLNNHSLSPEAQIFENYIMKYIKSDK